MTKTSVDLENSQGSHEVSPKAGSSSEIASKIKTVFRRHRFVYLSVGTYIASMVVFGLIVFVKGSNPFSVFFVIVQSTMFNGGSLEQIVLRTVPISLAALAVAVPARAGLVNVGGEGQLIMGAIGAAGVGLAVGSTIPGPLAWLLMAMAGAVAGAIWAGIPAVMRTVTGASEAVTTLLMNFVANDIMLYLIYQPWRDRFSSGQPQSQPLSQSAQLPSLFGSQLNIGVVVALALVIVTWYLLKRSHWGFALKVVGGNQEAARRAGLPISRLLISSMLVGGALAGLGGMLNFAGLEIQLVPGITATFGYIAFLASWLGRHDPYKVLIAASLFSAIALSSNGIQLNFGLNGSIVDILLALIVIAPLFLSKNRKALTK